MATKLVQLIQIAKQDTTDMKTFLNALTMKDLEKLLTTTSTSTRVNERCKVVSDALYQTDLTQLRELFRVVDLMIKSLPLATQFLIVSKYSDDGGNINWQSFISDVSDAIKAKVQATANCGGGRGLPM